MSDNLSEIRTTEDLINAVSVLYFNLNEIERNYYDIFLNPVAMTVYLQRYDSQGVLETIAVPNRASVSQDVLTGTGNPTGKTEAGVGQHYLDTNSGDIYYKISGTDSSGWTKIWTGLNLVEGSTFLTPSGDASKLTGLNMGSAQYGTLSVGRGGTGVNSITGLIKGNGASAFTVAEDGNDYMGPNSMTGLIAYYPLATIPKGWLLCNGGSYKVDTYPKLFEALTVTTTDEATGDVSYSYPYGHFTDDEGEKFNVPNLMNVEVTEAGATVNRSCFVRCWDGESAFNELQESNVGAHEHTYSGTTISETPHTHSRGTMNIGGSWYTVGENKSSSGNAVTVSDASGNYFDHDGGGGKGKWAKFTFTASRNWTGNTSEGSTHSHTYKGTTSRETSVNETRVLNKMLVPVIKM